VAARGEQPDADGLARRHRVAAERDTEAIGLDLLIAVAARHLVAAHLWLIRGGGFAGGQGEQRRTDERAWYPNLESTPRLFLVLLLLLGLTLSNL